MRSAVMPGLSLFCFAILCVILSSSASPTYSRTGIENEGAQDRQETRTLDLGKQEPDNPDLQPVNDISLQKRTPPSSVVQFGPFHLTLLDAPMIHGWYWVSTSLTLMPPSRVASATLLTFYSWVLYMTSPRPGSWAMSLPLPHLNIKQGDLVFCMRSLDGRLIPWWLVWYLARMIMVNVSSGYTYLVEGYLSNPRVGFRVYFKVTILNGGRNTRVLGLEN